MKTGEGLYEVRTGSETFVRDRSGRWCLLSRPLPGDVAIDSLREGDEVRARVTHAREEVREGLARVEAFAPGIARRLRAALEALGVTK